MLKIQRGSKGFTLIELLIVIAIIGILAAIAIPSYTGYVKRAKVQEVVHSMGAVKTAVMAYYTESNAGTPLLDVNGIKTTLGVDIPIKYLTENGRNGWYSSMARPPAAALLPRRSPNGNEYGDAESDWIWGGWNNSDTLSCPGLQNVDMGTRRCLHHRPSLCTQELANNLPGWGPRFPAPILHFVRGDASC